ncbi:MAG: TIGR02680 family protein [Lachnospiraceae bacterium]|nr:TIGR02680 family protein [Lachnospiraceae bacterium]
MNSRWQANKIGFLNFWYYDEQEFPFANGRMLLRGANGSGKSVTMQSAVPLLLDGNMSPERLDPFGTKDRKMSGYLLEEDDDREERTGYLYLEWKRIESETYLTIGIGLRARKGKPLDKWYFGLTDGRRIGRDFFLYKETDERVPLSKKEFENRLLPGGVLFDRQSEYMEYVNRQIFGFETVDEYKEMLDLLIQLRTPKLSKDFKPSVINDILSDSLQPLSDEDLRPMSEAIENMDTMNLNLKSRQEGRGAAEKINRVLDKYNRLILFEKADRLEQNQKQNTALEREKKAREADLGACETRIAELLEERVELDAQKDAMEKERDSLSKSDAVALKTREEELNRLIQEKEVQLQEQNVRLNQKHDQRIEQEAAQSRELDRQYEKEQELQGFLEEMDADAEERAFEEHGFFGSELKEHFQEAYSFHSHETQMNRTVQGIDRGVEVLRREDTCRRQADEQLQSLEKHHKETDAAQREVFKLETQMTEVKNEWKEKLYAWNGANRELSLDKGILKTMSDFADTYEETSDFAEVKQRVADQRMAVKGVLDGSVQQQEREVQELREQIEERKRELSEWENHREPEPERSEAVLKNRERLKALGISYLEFYKVIEFGQDLDETACDRLEEALLQMGILDALVVDEEDRERVLAMDPGCCDRYLFAKQERADKSILDVLDLNDAVNNIFFNQRITGILSSIAYDSDGITSISRDGSYQMGVLSGTVTGEHKAGFLGTRARERNRLAKIAECQETIAALEQELQEHNRTIEELQTRIGRLNQEYLSFPGDEDLRLSARMLSDAVRECERLRKEAIRMEEKLRETTAKQQELHKEASQIAEKLYLACNYETFLRAAEAARSYQRNFYQLKSGHEVYLQILSHVKELQERMENLDADMDQIRYDMGNTDRARKREAAERDSIREQLKLTDYEEIRERLDACVKWLNLYPDKIESCVKEQTTSRNRADFLKEQLKKDEEQLAEYRRKGAHLERCYGAELALGYVALPEEMMPGITAAKVRAYLAPDTQELQKEKIISDLNQVFFENRGMLTDYQPTQTNLFEELDQQAEKGDPIAKRLDIQARYKGVRISFQKLLERLDADIEELQELIRDGDRELFEDILSNTVSRKIRGKINGSMAWVEKMNELMDSMNTSSGLKLNLRWRSRTAEQEDQLDTRELVELLKKDYRLMREEEAAKLSLHFRSKVEEARKRTRDGQGTVSFYQVMKDALDYRKWFEFQLYSQKTGERQKELTNSVFGTFSGGEKAMSMYVPLFSAVVAKYQGGRADAPRIISLDEAFAGVDSRNIRDMFRLMSEFEFDFIINSQVLWGDCDTLDALAIYQLHRPQNAKFVTVMAYLWNGKSREMVEDERQMG